MKQLQNMLDEKIHAREKLEENAKITEEEQRIEWEEKKVSQIVTSLFN